MWEVLKNALKGTLCSSSALVDRELELIQFPLLNAGLVSLSQRCLFFTLRVTPPAHKPVVVVVPLRVVVPECFFPARVAEGRSRVGCVFVLIRVAHKIFLVVRLDAEAKRRSSAISRSVAGQIMCYFFWHFCIWRFCRLSETAAEAKRR